MIIRNKTFVHTYILHGMGLFFQFPASFAFNTVKPNFFLYLILFWPTTFSFAQEFDSIYKAKRAIYIEDKTGLIGLSAFNRNPNNQINISGKHNLVYNPNDPNTQGIRIQHKWLGLALGYSPQSLQQKKRGQTRELDLHLFLYGKKHYFDVYYIHYRGLYLENYERYDTLKNSYESFPLLPQLNLQSAGLNYFYLFNHQKFSLRSSFLHNEIQRRSAGSFILGSSVNYLHINNPTPLLPPELRPLSLPQESLVSGTFYGATVLPGYAHTFVLKRFYFTLAPMLGIMMQYQNFAAADDLNRNRYTLAFRSLGRLAFGYNGNRIYIAATAVNDSYNYMLSTKVRLTNQVSDARFIIGYRFTPVGVVKRISNKMDAVYKAP